MHFWRPGVNQTPSGEASIGKHDVLIGKMSPDENKNMYLGEMVPFVRWLNSLTKQLTEGFQAILQNSLKSLPLTHTAGVSASSTLLETWLGIKEDIDSFLMRISSTVCSGVHRRQYIHYGSVELDHIN